MKLSIVLAEVISVTIILLNLLVYDVSILFC